MSSSFTVVVGEGTNRQRELSYSAAEVDSISFEPRAAPGTSNGVSTTNQISTNSNPQQDAATTTVIKVGQTSNPQTASPKVNSTAATAQGANSSTAQSANNNNAAAAPPITLSVSVLADNTSNGWTDSKFVVQKGQRIRITATGQISLGNGNYSTPRGVATLADAQKLIAQSPTGGLIAVIGDDNNDFIFIGAEREFVATRDGALFLGVNEGNLNDNSGKFDVKIEIRP